MKFIVVLVLLTSMQLSAKVNAQQLSIRMENATFQQVAKEIEKQTGFTFLFSDAKVNGLKNLQLNFEQADLATILEQCLTGSGLSFRIVENTIVIVPGTPKAAVPQERTTIKGLVVDKSGLGIPGVTVLVKGTQVGTSTDANGKFSLELGSLKDLVLEFSFVGMEKKEVVVRDKQDIKVVLEETVQTIQEVVVTGIFERKKESFTGSATTYSADDLKRVGLSLIHI